jgi:hypothetical protein
MIVEAFLCANFARIGRKVAKVFFAGLPVTYAEILLVDAWSGRYDLTVPWPG